VGLSISVFADPAETAREVRALRETLPPSTRLWLGGAGAPSLKDLPDGIELTSTLDELDGALLRLAE
jgi:hypothetical protein